MGRNISIAISAKDNFSQAITTMRNANQSFNKDLTGLQNKLNELNKTKTTLKIDVAKAKEALKEAEKQFLKTGDAADKMNLEIANADYDNVRRNLSLVSNNAKQAEKDILSLTNAVSKMDNRASSQTVLGSNIDSVLSSITKSGAIGLVGNVLSEIAGTRISSAYGSEAGAIFGSVLSSGSMGAAIGSVIAPGIGTVIGAIGGSLLGYLQGQNSIYETQDGAFKEYYQDLYNKVLEAMDNSLESGKAIASKRETNRISFATLLGGENNANEFLNSLTEFASVTPFAYDDLTNISKVLLAYGYQQDELLPLLERVGDTGSALGMSNEDMKYVATALGRMRTTDKTTLEYLNPLLERGVDVWSYLAEASGKTKKEVQEMVNDGLVPGSKAAEAIADYMGYEFSGNMEKQAKTYSGLISTLEDAQTELDNAMGAGYNSTRKSGLQEQIDWLSGEAGTEMQDAYEKIGMWRASLDNQKEQYMRDAINSVMTGSLADSFEDSEQREALERLIKEYNIAELEYYDAKKFGSEEKMQEVGAKMGRIIAEAQAIATNEYNAGDGAQLLLETNKTLAENIKNDTALQEDYWDAGYVMGKQFSLGFGSALSENSYTIEEIYDMVGDDLNETQKNLVRGNKGRVLASNKVSSHATGISYVPYNNYSAVLHEGERVLTANENRNYGSSSVNMNNNFIINKNSDVQEVMQKVASLLMQALETGGDV